MRVRNPADLLVACLLIGLALLGLFLSRNLFGGTTIGMGPGYVPRLLCFIQIVLGIAIAALSFLRAGDPLEAWAPRNLLWVLAAMAFFALAIERLGVIVAVGGLVAISCLAHRGTRMIEVAALAVFMALFVVLVFVTGLGQPMRVLPAMPSF